MQEQLDNFINGFYMDLVAVDKIQWNLSKANLTGVRICVRYTQVFYLYILN